MKLIILLEFFERFSIFEVQKLYGVVVQFG